MSHKMRERYRQSQTSVGGGEDGIRDGQLIENFPIDKMFERVRETLNLLFATDAAGVAKVFLLKMPY